jgi:hypothetical protein
MAQDILDLEVGQAIARVGGSAATFNLQTYMEPPAPLDDPSWRIVAMARQRHAKPRMMVERELAHVAEAAERLQPWAATVVGTVPLAVPWRSQPPLCSRISSRSSIFALFPRLTTATGPQCALGCQQLSNGYFPIRSPFAHGLVRR